MNRLKIRPPRAGEQGMALVLTLMILMILTTMVLAISMNVVGEKDVTIGQNLAQRSLYAADSGVEAGRQEITRYARARLDSLAQAWAGNGAVISRPEQFFPANGIRVRYGAGPSYDAVTTLVFEDSSLELRSQTYNYRYATTATGTYHDGQRRIVSEGRLRVSATRGSFADYLIFTDTHLMSDNSPIWFHTTGTFDGRVHTNGEYRFAYFPTFQDLVTSVNQRAWYYNGGRNLELDASANGTIDKPNFYGGFNRGAQRIDLPTNSYSQERAALGGNPADTTPLSNSDIRSLLGLASGTKAPPTGVYLPHSGSDVTGGIYISGDAQQVLMSVSGNTQVLRITDAASKVTTVNINHSNGTTQIVPPTGSPVTYNGVPRGCLYTKGRVLDLRGPDRSHGVAPPALSSSQQLTIVSTGDIVIQRDIGVENFANGEGVLGLFTSGGDVRIASGAPDALLVDAFVMASASGKVFTVDSYDRGNYRGEVHLRGGMVTNYYGAFGTFGTNGLTGYGRDFHYDRRGFVPPYYPLTQRFVPDQPAPQVLAWREDDE